MMSQGLGLDMQHIPYRGASPALQELVAGRLQFYAVSAGGLLTLLREGTVRVLAVTGADRASPRCPACRPSSRPASPNTTIRPSIRCRRRRACRRPSSTRPARCSGASWPKPTRRSGCARSRSTRPSSARTAFRAFLAAERIRWRDIIARTGLRLEG